MIHEAISDCLQDNSISFYFFLPFCLSECEEYKLVYKTKSLKPGYDSAFNIEEVSSGKIQTKDLSVPFNLDHKFDWVLSLEVGEHIPKKKEQVFMDNLVNHACKGNRISFWNE